MAEETPIRVVVLGGGPAGLAAAWYLSEADLARRAEDPSSRPLQITVYQQGWRLGGKGAASRGEAGRIEEHGIHLFGNFYGNALGMVRAVYRATGRTLDQELLPNNLSMVLDHASGTRFSSRVAASGYESVDRGNDNVQPELLWPKLLESMVENTIGLTRIPAGPPKLRQKLSAWVRHRIADAVTGNATNSRTARRLAALAPDAGEVELDAAEYRRVARSVARWRRIVVTPLGWLAGLGPAARLRHAQADLIFTSLHGALQDRVFTEGIDTIDDIDHLSWLTRHGLDPRTLASETVLTIPNICFQYPGGDTTRPPSMSAAAFLTFILRQLAAPGPNFWYFRRGTGESVVLPLYEALAAPTDGRRPVRFEFFTRVSDVVPSEDGSTIDRVVVRRHARPGGDRYDPIAEAAGLHYWPAEPLLDRIHPADRAAIEHVDVENWYRLLPDEPGTDEVLEAGEHFDAVVLAIPPPTLPHSAPSLLQDPRWQRLVEGQEFIATQGVQLWMAPPGPQLGLPDGPYRGPRERWSTAKWKAPNSCWVDFSDLIEEEHWERARPESLSYFCGPLSLGDIPPPGEERLRDFAAIATEQVFSDARTLMSELHLLLPGTDQRSPYDMLVSPDGSAEPRGPARLATQYLRANVYPTELYGLSRPGDLAVRPKAWESGYDNMVLAGDWTFTGLNINSFEGATTSGAIASYALTGRPAKHEIIGYGFLRPDCGPDRPGPPILERIKPPA